MIERDVLSPLLCYRILGQSRMIERPNTYLWMLAANTTAATADLVSRSVVIRLRHYGDPNQVRFLGDPLQYARAHRTEILEEVFGLVQAWLVRGRPMGAARHRCRRWASVVGGILGVAGLGEFFLANSREAASEIDESFGQLVALGEYVVNASLGDMVSRPEQPVAAGKPPRDWVTAMERVGILTHGMGSSSHGKSVCAGKFLSAHLNKSCSIETSHFAGEAILECHQRGSRQTLYYFRLAASNTVESPTHPGVAAADSAASPTPGATAADTVTPPPGAAAANRVTPPTPESSVTPPGPPPPRDALDWTGGG